MVEWKYDSPCLISACTVTCFALSSDGHLHPLPSNALIVSHCTSLSRKNNRISDPWPPRWQYCQGGLLKDVSAAATAMAVAEGSWGLMPSL